MKEVIKTMVKSRLNDKFFDVIANILEDSLEIDETTPVNETTEKITIFCNTMLRSAMANVYVTQKIYKMYH